MANKIYIYCTKSKPYLYKDENEKYYLSNEKENKEALNGKVVANFTLEEIKKMGLDTNEGLVFENMYNKESCLSLEEMASYVGDNYYYAWPIKNLNILDTPMEITDFYYTFVSCGRIDTKFCLNHCSHNDDRGESCWCDRGKNSWTEHLKKAPQSWCYAQKEEGVLKEQCVIVSIKPKWTEKILNGEKTIEIRKTAPKLSKIRNWEW